MPEVIALKNFRQFKKGQVFRQPTYMAKALVATGHAAYHTRDMQAQPVVKTVAPTPPPPPPPAPVVEPVVESKPEVTDVAEDATIGAPEVEAAKTPPLPSKPSSKTTKKDAK